MKKDLEVGQTVWLQNGNRRYYTEPEQKGGFGELIERGHWVPNTVVGETSRSWLVGSKFVHQKISKKDFREGRLRGIAATVEEVDVACFLSPPIPYRIEKAISARLREATPEELLRLIEWLDIEGLPAIGEDCDEKDLKRLARDTPWAEWAKKKLEERKAK